MGFLWVFWDSVGIFLATILGFFFDSFGDYFVIFWDSFGFLGFCCDTFGNYFGIILGFFGIIFGILLGIIS